MEHISQTLDKRFSAATQQTKQSTNPDASIEETVGNTTTSSIELPAAIDELIDNKMYRNKFKSLIRRGHLQDLLELADLAQSRDNPSHWFAKVTAKARFEQTLKFLAKAREIVRMAVEVAKRIQVPTDSLNVVYKACWRVRGHALRLAIQAAETGRADKFKYFAWLAWKGTQAARMGA